MTLNHIHNRLWPAYILAAYGLGWFLAMAT